MMYMSDAEILGKYGKAERKNEIIQILADLNGCSKGEMKKFLLANGIPESDFEVKRGRKPKEKVGTEKKKDEQKERPGVEQKQIPEYPNLTPDDESQVDRTLAIPAPVQKAISIRIKVLTEEIIKLENERDFLCDYLEGR